MEEQNNKEVQEKAFDGSVYRQVISTQVSRGNAEPGVLTIVNSEHNGKRISLSEEVMKKLNNPELLQFRVCDEGLAVSEDMGEGDNTFFIRKNGRKGVIYAAMLVDEFTEVFNLDFSNRTSITFHEVEYYKEPFPVAVIKLKR